MRLNRSIECLSASVVLVILLSQPCVTRASDVGLAVDWAFADQLQKAGYSTDSIDGVIQATKDQMSPVRMVAVWLLGHRYAKENREVVLQVLRQVSLHDPDIRPRAWAADLLAENNDPSGKEVLVRTYLELVPGGDDPDRCKEVKRDGLRDALMIGEMLAKYDNPIGMPLAEYVMNTDSLDPWRFAGVPVLGAIACRTKVCPDEAKRALKTLEELASKSENPHVLSAILQATIKGGFPPEDKARVQNILYDSGKLPPHDRAMLDSVRYVERMRAQRTAGPRRLCLEPSELEMPISHRESRSFQVALRNNAESCVVKEVLSDEAGIAASASEAPDKNGYVIDVTVKETAMQNRTCYVLIRLEGCSRPFVVIPIKFFRQVASQPACGPASRPVGQPK